MMANYMYEIVDFTAIMQRLIKNIYHFLKASVLPKKEIKRKFGVRIGFLFLN